MLRDRLPGAKYSVWDLQYQRIPSLELYTDKVHKSAVQFSLFPQIISAIKYEELSELKTKPRNTTRFQTRNNTKKDL